VCCSEEALVWGGGVTGVGGGGLLQQVSVYGDGQQAAAVELVGLGGGVGRRPWLRLSPPS
jgi:hypothetical protein